MNDQPPSAVLPAPGQDAVIVRSLAVGPVRLTELVQGAGDVSVGPGDALVLQRALCRVHFTADCGAGRFSDWSRHGSFGMAPLTGSAHSVVDDVHRMELVALDWRRLRDLDVEDRLPGDGDFGAIHGRLQFDARMGRIIEDLWTLDADGDGLAAEMMAVAMIERLGRWRQRGASGAASRNERLAPGVLRRSLALLTSEEDGASAVSLGEIARAAGLSPSHFCRAFSRTTGLAPHRYRILARIDRARRLLEQPKTSITEVARSVGYADATYFSRLFRKETGFSPRAWRQARFGSLKPSRLETSA